jgi:aminodeoxyfutalosine synthase
MAAATDSLDDLERKAASGERFTPADAERLAASADLIAIGMVGHEAARRRAGSEITFVRVAPLAGGDIPDDRGDPGEVRLIGLPASLDEAVSRVAAAAGWAAGVPLTGYTALELLDLAGHDRRALVAAAAALHAAGLEAIAEFALDGFDTTDEAIEVAQAIARGGLAVRRLTIEYAPLADRLALIRRAAELAAACPTVRAFAPLPRRDPVEAPSTGYDDVRTIALAAVVAHDIPSIQVDWPLYGPKLAQVALTYGANDVDGIAPVDAGDLGPRRAPREDILRQIRAAGGTPVERDARHERRA